MAFPSALAARVPAMFVATTRLDAAAKVTTIVAEAHRMSQTRHQHRCRRHRPRRLEHTPRACGDQARMRRLATGGHRPGAVHRALQLCSGRLNAHAVSNCPEPWCISPSALPPIASLFSVAASGAKSRRATLLRCPTYPERSLGCDGLNQRTGASFCTRSCGRTPCRSGCWGLGQSDCGRETPVRGKHWPSAAQLRPTLCPDVDFSHIPWEGSE
jgi:hypothetical protein